MRVLLTGSSGWLGRFLAPRLREEGYEVVGLDVAPGVHTSVIGSVADKATVDRAFREFGIEAVIHAGALHKPDIVRYSRQAFVDVNVTGTLNLLETASANHCRRFVFTSTTSLMISEAIRAGKGGGTTQAAWLDENFGPLEPRNIYGVTKYAAEQLCALHHREHGLPIIVLRTGRFFPEEDDTHRDLIGPNRKANEFLGRRLTVEDAAEAHVAALNKTPEIGFGLYIVAAAAPFVAGDARDLMENALAVIGRYYSDAAELYARAGWQLPQSIDRVYDSSLAERELGFRCRTDFRAVLEALREESSLPFAHDPAYVSPKEHAVERKGEQVSGQVIAP